MSGPVKIIDERGVYPSALDQAVAEQRQIARRAAACFPVTCEVRDIVNIRLYVIGKPLPDDRVAAIVKEASEIVAKREACDHNYQRGAPTGRLISYTCPKCGDYFDKDVS